MLKEPKFKIFIVEDDDWYRELLVHMASLNPDFEVKSFSTAKDFLKALSENPDVVSLDYLLPDMEGIKVFQQIKQFNPEIEVIIVSKQEKIEPALELIKAGAYDYLTKTPDTNERYINTLNNILKNKTLKKQISRLEKEVGKKYSFEKAIIGKSEPIKKIFSLMEKAAATSITVLITGETGTGKELVAKSIHFNSSRSREPLVTVNMAAIPHELAESELFGHEKGSFTGALGQRIGKFEQAKGGTLFLDEIGEMDLSLQAKLLRVLQEKELTRVGGDKLVKIDCRIIAATNKNLNEEVKKGAFREDLYYRLFGLVIDLPPLRSRGNDLLLIARHFIDSFCKENNMEPVTLSKEAQQKLMNHPFPGNIRELKSSVELAVVMSSGNEVDADDIQLNNNFSLPSLLSQEKTLADYEKEIIRHFLHKYNQNIVSVAEKLGIGKSTIYRLLKEEPEFFEK
jgi:two-component system, NtrC family, response regulator AtoC